ncbi:MAG: hypothetical protein ACLUE8_05830 [Lachnospiraceae bacterium]
MIRDAGSVKVKGYEYHDLCYRMDSIQSYFQFNLDMLNTELRHNFFREDRPIIHQGVRDEMPARYMDEAVAVNSMVADGRTHQRSGGAQRHLPRRKDRQGSHSQATCCVIMQDARIDEGVYLGRQKAIDVRVVLPPVYRHRLQVAAADGIPASL